MNIQFNSTKGVGLIEVLIATVVISLGLLSLASMQGSFLSESGINKAKAEAQVIAEQKIEEFRNVVTKNEFIALASENIDTPEPLIIGKNATFNRSWTIGSLSSDPETKTITVSVTWDNETIELTSELAWNIVGNSSVYSSTGGNAGMASSLPSPSSDAAKVEAMDTISEDAVADGYGFQRYRNADGKDVIADESYNDADGDGDADDGNFAVGRQLTCEHVCLSVKGRVFLENDAAFNQYEKIRDDDVTVCSWKEDIDPDTAGDQLTVTETVAGGSFSKREYICYFGGDCSSETDLTYGTAGCPSDYATLDPVNVRGGWRGNIGIVGFTNPTSDTLCFLGQVGGVTRRNYKTTRTDGTNITQEGINTNYECHDFLMINNPSDNATACSDYTLISASTINKELIGSNATAINSISTDASSCDVISYVFSGSIAGTNDERSSLVLSVNSVSCEIGPTTGGPDSRNTLYSCTAVGEDSDVITLDATSEEATPNFSTSSSVTLGDVISAPDITFTAF